jgi:predicted dehydrogenase
MKRVRIGVIGAGWFATSNHIPTLSKREDVDLKAVCRLGRNKLDQIREAYGFSVATEDYHELIAQELDGVIVSSPHNLHYEHCRAALESGLHVMCEKPMTLHGAEAWNLVELARSRGRHLLIPYGWHYKDFIEKAKRIMDDRGVGEIEHIACNMASPTKEFFAGHIEQVPEKWTPTLSVPEASTWQDKERGGGYGHGQLTHSTALFLWLTGLRCRKVSGRMTHPNSKVDMYNSATVEFEGGATGTISGSATLPDGDPFQILIQIFGDRGVLLLDVEAGRERLQLRRHDGRHLDVTVTKGEGAYSCEVPPNRFIDLIQGRGVNNSPGEVAARSVELIEGLYLSAALGQDITIGVLPTGSTSYEAK